MNRRDSTIVWLFLWAALIGLFFGCVMTPRSDKVIAEPFVFIPVTSPVPMVTEASSRANALPPPQRVTFTVTNYCDALSGAEGYQFGVGTQTGQYTRLIDAGTNTRCGISGLAIATRYYIAVRGYNRYSTSQWSAALVWPRQRTNWWEVAPNSYISVNMTGPWTALNTNRLYEFPGNVGFIRATGGKAWIVASNNITGYQHFE